MAPAIRDGTALREPSIVGSFSPPPWLEFVAESVAPDVCPLVCAALQRPRVGIREGARNDSTPCSGYLAHPFEKNTIKNEKRQNKPVFFERMCQVATTRALI